MKKNDITCFMYYNIEIIISKEREREDCKCHLMVARVFFENDSSISKAFYV